MIFSIISAIFLLILLVMKSKMRKAFISNKILHVCFLITSLLLIISGIVWFLILLFKGSALKEADTAISMFLIGIAITGFIAETPEDTKRKKKK